MEQFIFELDNRGRNSTGDDTIAMTGDEHFHLSRVMRLKAGDTVLATDGKGVTCLCTIQRIDKDRSTCKVIEEYRDLNASRRRFCIAMSVLKPVSKLEFAVEKCTELGAASFMLFHCERSERVNLRLDRMGGIVKSAVKQSLQSRIPELEVADNLEDVASQSFAYDRQFVLHEKSGNALDEFLSSMKKDASAIALVGPEGGFSEKEIEFLTGRNFKAVSLGKSRLRSETAAVKVASLLAVY